MAGSGGSGGVAIHEPVGTSLLVQVLDTQNQPVSSAVVTVQGGTPRPTDGAGYILFENLAPGRFSARVERFGYAPASVVAELPEGVHGGTEVHLVPLPPRIPFDATAGAALDQGPVHVTIPSMAIVDDLGEPVTGPVEATIVPLDPSQGLVNAPGPLEGISADSGARVGLESLFMAEVTLWQGSQRVQLAPGKRATLELVLPDAVAAQVYEWESIPAWWFDLDAGIWREEGAGVIQGSVAEPGKMAWVAEVGHFSWWNSDRPWWDTHCFRMQVISAVPVDGAASSGVPVGALGMSYTGRSPGTLTDASGSTCLDIMWGGTAQIHVGPMSAPLATVTVTGSGPASDCAGNGAACTLLAPIPLPLGSVCTPGTWKDCGYSGPAGTEGVGICQGAKDYCNSSGTGWTGCDGEVLPEAEGCNSPLDDDCDGLVNEVGDSCACQPGDTKPCYTGPAGTLDIGICKAGTRACVNGFFGPCLTEVKPQQESCATPVDDDCDGTTQCTVWSKGFPGGYQHVHGLAIDSEGNALLAGEFDGSVDFGGGSLPNAGSYDICVAKLDTDGNHLWSKRFGNALLQTATAAATDSADNVWLAGYFDGTVDFGGGTLTTAGGWDIFVAKLDANGDHLWSKRFGDSAYYQSADAMATDSAGNVVLAGELGLTADFGGGPLTSTGMGTNLFVAKLDPDGNHVWSKRFGSTNDLRATKIGIDSAGNVLVAGILSGTADFGGGPLTTDNDYDIVVAKLDADGNHVWSKRFGDGGEQRALGMAIDSAGNVLLTGNFEGTVNFGGGPFTSAGSSDIYLAKLSASGGHVWSKRFGDADYESGTATAVDGAGNVIITGTFRGTVNFGGPSLIAVGSENFTDDTFVVELDASGNHLWSRRFAGYLDNLAPAVDGNGNVLLTGDFWDPVNLGTGTLESSGYWDNFLVKFPP